MRERNKTSLLLLNITHDIKDSVLRRGLGFSPYDGVYSLVNENRQDS